MRSLHICYVEMGYPHHHGGGGAGTYVQLVGRELVRRGYKISVVAANCPDCPTYTTDAGIHVYRPRLSGSLHWYIGKIAGLRTGSLALRYLEYGWSIARFLEQLHKRQPIDLVEYTEGGDFWHALRLSFPYVVHLHGSRYTCLRASGRSTSHGDWYHRRLELAFIQRACYVMSPSRALVDIVVDEMGHPVKQCEVLPYPLDPRLLEPRQFAERATGTGPVVLFAARNDPVKGADTLLRAVPIIRQRWPNAKFSLFGYEPADDATLPDGVRCYPFVAKEELLANYPRADICVVPSLWDNSPNTVYEAMAAGKAVVASRVGGIPELVEDGVTGVLVEPNDPVQLANAIIRLLHDEDERAAMGRNGRERIQRIADLDDNVSRRVDLYRQIISEWTSRRASRNYAHHTR